MYLIYGNPTCSWCKRAVKALQDREIPHKYVCLTTDDDAFMRVIMETGRKTVPQIFKEADGNPEGIYIGGHDALIEHLKENE